MAEEKNLKFTLQTQNLCAGYGSVEVVKNVNIEIKKGEIVTLIGPNGEGKSTVLKTITRQIKALGGKVYFSGEEADFLGAKKISKTLSMVMTQRVRSGSMTCRDVVASGRYPYTGYLGLLKKEDVQAVDEAISLLGAVDFANIKFSSASDGQKQRIMLARAVCQDTDLIVLDEPSSFLDLRHKIDIARLIFFLAKKKSKAVLMSLHDLDMAKELSDFIICISNHKVLKSGRPEEIFTGDFIQKLFGLEKNEFKTEICTVNFNLDEIKKIPQENLCEKESEKVCEEKEEFSCKQKIPFEKNKIFPSAKKRAKVIMVQGTMSSAGKSFLVAALCRIFHQDGFKVAPFKSQNMALNSFVTKEGLEMGRAQAMQAEACGIEPLVCMNPVLLKPTGDTFSQVIVNGKPFANMSARKYFDFKTSLIPQILCAFKKLEEENDIIVIEGAGSPAEINLKQNDIVNMGLASLLDSNVILAGDIDRGGVFAQLLGTLSLLEKNEKKRVKGLVINKFRGDKSILDPGIKMLEKKCGVPVSGVVPFIRVNLDDEDSLSSRFYKKENSLVNIGIVHLPHISNFTDFNVFEQISGVCVNYIENAFELEKMDAVFIPGSKNTIGDLRWLKKNNFDSVIKKFAQEKMTFGICGGFQMLGCKISDPLNLEGGGFEEGLCLLDTETVFSSEKKLLQTSGTLKNFSGEFDFLSGKNFCGYEIHFGKTNSNSGKDEYFVCKGNTGGTYIHGFFDCENIALDLVKKLALKKGIKDLSVFKNSFDDYKKFKESQYDFLADSVRKNLDMKSVYKMLKVARV